MIQRLVGQGSWRYSLWGLSSTISLVSAMLLLTSSWWDPSSTQTKCQVCVLIVINLPQFQANFHFPFFAFQTGPWKWFPYFVLIFNLLPVDWTFYKIIKRKKKKRANILCWCHDFQLFSDDVKINIWHSISYHCSDERYIKPMPKNVPSKFPCHFHIL